MYMGRGHGLPHQWRAYRLSDWVPLSAKSSHPVAQLANVVAFNKLS